MAVLDTATAWARFTAAVERGANGDPVGFNAAEAWAAWIDRNDDSMERGDA